MMQCFDTLTEYIQGPCRDNQIALIQDNFLDLSSNLLAIDEIKEEYEEELRQQIERNEVIEEDPNQLEMQNQAQNNKNQKTNNS